MISFEPIAHRYSVIGKGVDLKSVSYLISLVKQPFDREHWLVKKAKERGITREELDEEWKLINKLATDKGTAYHEVREERYLKNKGIPSLSQDGLKIAHDLSDLKPGLYPELMLYNFNYMVAGTSDCVTIYPDKTFSIGDFKTNKKLEFKGFKKYDPDYKEKRTVRMKFPLQHIDDCNGMHYTIQLSTYALLLEEFGYKCKELYIDHIVFDGDEPVNEIRYPIQYLKREAESLLKYYKSIRNNGKNP